LSRIRKTSSNLNDPWYDAFNWSESKIYLIRKLIEQKKITQSPKIDVATIHSVKGGEADNVILMEDITQPVFEQLDRDPDSEHRVFYVGVTRAKENLIIVKSQSQYRYRL
jgi:superfamily I DNA/RNA helicase